MVTGAISEMESEDCALGQLSLGQRPRRSSLLQVSPMVPRTASALLLSPTCNDCSHDWVFILLLESPACVQNLALSLYFGSKCCHDNLFRARSLFYILLILVNVSARKKPLRTL